MSKKPRGDSLYNRSFFLNLGGLLLTLPILIWFKQGDQSHSWPLFAWILFFCLPIVGGLMLVFGIIASDRKIDSSIYIVPTGSGLTVAILAFPLYFISLPSRLGECCRL
jgi:hypothetical protein